MATTRGRLLAGLVAPSYTYAVVVVTVAAAQKATDDR